MIVCASCPSTPAVGAAAGAARANLPAQAIRKVCGGRRARRRRIERRAHRDQAAGRSSTSTFGKSMSVSATLLV